MELSAIINKYDLPLTRSERNLVAALPVSASAQSADQYDQRMKALADAREIIKQMPDRETVERQVNMEKAGMLKERLKRLRQMIPYMSPAAAKAAMTEMKQIAAQLASLEGASSGGNGAPLPATTTTAAATPESNSAAQTAQDKVQSNETDLGNSGAQQGHQDVSGSTKQTSGVKSVGGSSEDSQLKEAITELRNLYNIVLAALKRKQAVRGGGQMQKTATYLKAYDSIPDISSRVAVKV